MNNGSGTQVNGVHLTVNTYVNTLEEAEALRAKTLAMKPKKAYRIANCTITHQPKYPLYPYMVSTIRVPLI